MVRTPSVQYCDDWNLRHGRPQHPLSQRAAYGRHRTRTPYLVVVRKPVVAWAELALVFYRFAEATDDKSSPVRTRHSERELPPDPYVTVRFLDGAERIIAYRGFVRVSGERLFMSEYGMYSYESSILFRSELFLYSPNGSVRLIQTLRGRSDETAGPTDVSAHFLPIPDFGAHEDFITFDHYQRAAARY